MTRTITLIIGIAVSALAVAVPTAFAKGQPVDSPRVAQLLLEKNGTVDRSIVGERFQETPQWHQALMARSQAMNDTYLPGESTPVVGERFQQAPQWQQALSARSEALNRQNGLGEYTVSNIDAREKALTAKSEAQMAATPYPDWFERAANTAVRDYRGTVVVDDRFDLHPKDISATVAPASSSGREIDFPQVGIGLGLGILLALGLYLTVRITRVPPVAH
jgi:hypothetical protein